MQEAVNDIIPTRATLLERIKDSGDHSSWQDFFDIYEKLIFSVALQAGLNRTEAEEVVQETMISVARQIPGFKYDPANGSFKGWLIKTTHWRITDQLRRRRPADDTLLARDMSCDTVVQALSPDQMAQDGRSHLDALLDAEWEKNIFNAAINKVKRQLDPQKYQVFDFYVNKNWPAEKVAAAFGLNIEQVYLAKHRVKEMIAAEIKKLELETN